MLTTKMPAPATKHSSSAAAAVAAGLLTGTVTGIAGALASAPLRRLANVGDRALVNGATVVGGALALWLVLGLLYAALRSDRVQARRAVLAGAALAAVAATALVTTALSGFADRLPALAVPLILWVTAGGAVLFLGLIRLLSRPGHMPLGFLTASAVAASIVVAVLVSALDRTPSVHYTLSKLPSSATGHVVAAAPAAAVPSVTAAGSASASQTAATVALAVATPAATSSAQAVAPSTAAPAASGAAAAPAGGALHFTVAGGSEAAFTVHEKLTQLPSPSDAVGKTQSITGDVYLVPGQGVAQSPASTITVDLSTLATDSSMRDNFIKRSTLQTSQYPTATFTITRIDGFPASYKEGDQVKVTVAGTMTVHGVQQQVSWTGTAQYAGGQLEAVLSTDVTMTQFGMTPPQVPVVQSVDNTVHLDLHILMQQQ